MKTTNVAERRAVIHYVNLYNPSHGCIIGNDPREPRRGIWISAKLSMIAESGSCVLIGYLCFFALASRYFGANYDQDLKRLRIATKKIRFGETDLQELGGAILRAKRGSRLREAKFLPTNQVVS